jgi:hypothetical protein
MTSFIIIDDIPSSSSHPQKQTGIQTTIQQITIRIESIGHGWYIPQRQQQPPVFRVHDT